MPTPPGTLGSGVQVPPLAESPTMRYTVMDWALWAKAQGEPGADELIAYLRYDWPKIRPTYDVNTTANRKRNVEHAALEQALATPVKKGPGARIMGAMGWHEGEGLGPAGGGMTEPLCPDLAHQRGEGLGYSS